MASLTQDYDVDRSVPVADRLLGRYVPVVVMMPQRGKKNAAETARNKPMTASGRSSSISDTPKNLPSAAGAGKKIKSGKPARNKPTTT